MLVHAGYVFIANESNRVWIPLCGLSPRTDTVFWSICGLDDDVPVTCLRCLVKEFT